LERRKPNVFLQLQNHHHHHHLHQNMPDQTIAMVLQFIFVLKLQVNLVKKFVRIVIYLNQNCLQKKNEQN
jgi:aspartate carbamoyltransferase regulatory subunit